MQEAIFNAGQNPGFECFLQYLLFFSFHVIVNDIYTIYDSVTALSLSLLLKQSATEFDPTVHPRETWRTQGGQGSFD